MFPRILAIATGIAFTASAVLGLCAMADMAMHGGLCASSGAGAILCSANPLRDAALLALIALTVAVAVVLAPSVAVPRDAAGGAFLYAFSDAPPLIPLPLTFAFSDGLLNPKAF